MSETPRTDKWKRRATEFDPRCPVVHAGNCDDLERELARTRQAAERLANLLEVSKRKAATRGEMSDAMEMQSALANWEEVKGE